jgi:hypothetical protein
MVAGNGVVELGSPGQLPPTARLASMYIGTFMSAGVGSDATSTLLM